MENQELLRDPGGRLALLDLERDRTLAARPEHVRFQAAQPKFLPVGVLEGDFRDVERVVLRPRRIVNREHEAHALRPHEDWGRERGAAIPKRPKSPTHATTRPSTMAPSSCAHAPSPRSAPPTSETTKSKNANWRRATITQPPLQQAPSRERPPRWGPRRCAPRRPGAARPPARRGAHRR